MATGEQSQKLSLLILPTSESIDNRIGKTQEESLQISSAILGFVDFGVEVAMFWNVRSDLLTRPASRATFPGHGTLRTGLRWRHCARGRPAPCRRPVRLAKRREKMIRNSRLQTVAMTLAVLVVLACPAQAMNLDRWQPGAALGGLWTWLERLWEPAPSAQVKSDRGNGMDPDGVTYSPSPLPADNSGGSELDPNG
jgi:hypothetical protein